MKRGPLYDRENGVAEVTAISGSDYDLATSGLSPGPCLGVVWGASRLVRSVVRIDSDGALQVDMFSSNDPGAVPRETFTLQPTG